MINKFVRKIIAKGNGTITALIFLLSISSIIFVYGVSSTETTASPLEHLRKSCIITFVGFAIMITMQWINYGHFRLLSVVAVLGSIILLILAASQNTKIGGSEASRWYRIFGISVQPSLLAGVSILLYISTYLSDQYHKMQFHWKVYSWALLLPIMIVLLLVLKSSNSMAIIIFITIMGVLLVGNFPIKDYLFICLIIAGLVGLFVFIAMEYPDLLPNRFDTFSSRFEAFFSNEKSVSDQSEQAKMAVATNGIGLGNSIMKNLVAKSYADFIFAILIEEMTVWGAIALIIVYFILFYQCLRIGKHTKNSFGKLLVFSMAFFTIIRIFVHIGVSVGALPVTGQDLPFFTLGGTATLINLVIFGVILSVNAFEKRTANSKKT